MKFEPLDPKKHDRKNFDCGVEPLNTYLSKYANQDQKRSLTRVYVLVADSNLIIGYYSLSAHSVLRDYLPEDIKISGYDDLPFLLLGRLAVDKNYQGKGYGDTLIFDAFVKTSEMAKNIGIYGMIVEAKNQKAASFYEGFGFKRLHSTPTKLVLPMSALDILLKN